MGPVRFFHLGRSISSLVLLVGVVSLVGAGVLTEVPQPVAAQANPAPAAAESAELEEAKRLSQQAFKLSEQGDFAAAIPLTERVLAIREKTLGPEHEDVGTSLNNLAMLYFNQGDYGKAEPLYQRALAIWEKVLGPEHEDIAISLNNLAVLYMDQGNYAKAEPLYQRALSIRKKTLGLEHPLVAECLNNLASLYDNQGNHAKAKPLYLRALAISEKAQGPEHEDVGTSLNNLAVLYFNQGDYGKAEPLYQRALAIWEKVLGPENYYVSLYLNNLALLYDNQGKQAKAEPLYRRAPAIQEKVLDPEHPQVAVSLNNLALLYFNQGDYAKAEPLLQRTLAIFQKVLDLEHPLVALCLYNLASLYDTQGDIARASEFMTRSTNITESNLALNLTTGSEADKQAYMATLRDTTNQILSLHLQSASNNPQAAHLAITTVLRRKGRILDAVTDSLEVMRQHLKPEDQGLFDQLNNNRAQLATLLFQGSDRLKLSTEQDRSKVATLKGQIEQLENTLARHSAQFRTETQPVTIEAVQRLIPPKAALVELVLYKPFNPKAPKTDQRWGPPRYAAYVLHSQGEPRWVDLGEAKPIDQAVGSFHDALVAKPLSSQAQLKQVARKLDEKLMQPIRRLLVNTRTVLLSPDSQLNRIPFAALVDEHNHYLLENFSFTYLSSGRDLLRLQAPAVTRSNVMVVANPDFKQSSASASAPVVSRSFAQQRSTDLGLIQFDPLPGMAEEAKVLGQLLPKATILTGSKASENAIKQVQGPEILHVATHGFFLRDLPLVAAPAVSTGAGFVIPPGDLAGKPTADPSGPTSGPPENPLLRSVIALAGFNNRKSGTEDGVLTALEVAGLDLRGTKLVVLSACDTGVGDVENGEGVYGLRRALVMAGADSQLISLWKVHDVATKDLMQGYYQRLLKQEGRSEALRQTQLEMLNTPNYQHPYYWAAFIPSGNWSAMEAKGLR